MKKRRTAEGGQALILIVFAIVGLIGLTGLAIDGGNAYSDRRHAQNAADTGALAAALTKIRHASDSDPVAKWAAVQNAALDIAAQNGYSNSDPSKVVQVFLCSDAGATCSLPAGETHPENYIQVTIRSTIRTYFAPVVGIRNLTNSVQAVAKAVDPVVQSWYDGNALVALMPGCKPNGWPDDPFVISGNSVTVVNGISGIFVNSNCSNAFSSSSNTTVSSPGICVVGGGTSSGNINPPPQYGCGQQYDPSNYVLPPLTASSCTTAGHIDGNATTGYYASPGNYSGTFPNVSPAGNLKLGRGIYCLNNAGTALNINAGWTVTTDLNNNGFNNIDSTEGVVFYIPNGGISINGAASVKLSAMEDAGAGTLKGYLIYLPPTNTSTVSIAGGGDSELRGTILAPGARIAVSGNSTSQSFQLECQIIGYSVSLGGSGLVQITYNQALNGQTYTQPKLQPYNNK